jgi:hypothetical protein
MDATTLIKDMTNAPPRPFPHLPSPSSLLRLPQIQLDAVLSEVPPSYRPAGSLPSPSAPEAGQSLHETLSSEAKAGLKAAGQRLAHALGQELPEKCKPQEVRALAQALWQQTAPADWATVAHTISLACAVAEAADVTAKDDYASAVAAESTVLTAAAQELEFVAQLTDMVALSPEGGGVAGGKGLPPTVQPTRVLLKPAIVSPE